MMKDMSEVPYFFYWLVKATIQSCVSLGLEVIGFSGKQASRNMGLVVKENKKIGTYICEYRCSVVGKMCAKGNARKT